MSDIDPRRHLPKPQRLRNLRLLLVKIFASLLDRMVAMFETLPDHEQATTIGELHTVSHQIPITLQESVIVLRRGRPRPQDGSPRCNLSVFAYLELNKSTKIMIYAELLVKKGTARTSYVQVPL